MRRSAVLFFVLAAGLAIARHMEPQEPPGGGAATAHEAEPGFDHTTIWKTANFVLLAAALGYLTAKRGGPFFAARTAEVRRGLEEAARLKVEAETRYAEIDRRLANLGQEIETLRSQAKHESDAEGERVREETERQFQRIKAQTEQEIAAAVDAAKQELRGYAANLAIDIAARRIQDQLSPDAEHLLIEGMLGRLDERADGQAMRAS